MTSESIPGSAGEELNGQESRLDWFVAHTRPRCEKKLAQFCEREKICATLPCYRTVHRYRGKTVAFQKPLFPGYVFLHMLALQRQRIYQSDYVANLLEVIDQELFERQLNDILLALETDLEVQLAPDIKPGCQVRIKTGPLRGVLGWVENRTGLVQVLLRLDFINQAAAVRIEADNLELV